MGNLPGIAVLQPFLGLLRLVAVLDVLFENPEIVAQAIADRGQVQGGDRVQKAGGEAAEAAVAQPCVDLVFPEILPIEPLLGHRSAANVLHLQIDDVVAHHAPDQELERQVVDPLDVLLVMGCWVAIHRSTSWSRTASASA